MDELRSAECWTEGFVKAAAERGYQNPAQVNHLLKMCSHLNIMSKYPEAFEQGVVSVLAKKASLEKESLNPVIKYLGLGLGALFAGAGASDIYDRVRGYATIHDLPGRYPMSPMEYTQSQMAPHQQRLLDQAAGLRRAQEAGRTATQQMTDIMGNSPKASMDPRTRFSPVQRFGQ